MPSERKKQDSAFHGVADTTPWWSLLWGVPGLGTVRELKRLYGRIEEEASVNPWRVVACAVAVGFVAGGGVFSRLTVHAVRLTAKTAVRAAAAGVVARALVELARQDRTRAPIDVG